MYERFTADDARGMFKVGPNELQREISVEHRRIKEVAKRGEREVSMLHWDYEHKALHEAVRRELEAEGYTITVKSVVMGGVRQKPMPYISW